MFTRPWYTYRDYDSLGLAPAKKRLKKELVASCKGLDWDVHIGEAQEWK